MWVTGVNNASLAHSLPHSFTHCIRRGSQVNHYSWPPKTERKTDLISLVQSFSALNLWKAYNSFCFGVIAVQNKWKDVNSCEARISFVCHHLSHKDVHFAAKQRGGFTVIFCRHNCPSVTLYWCTLVIYSLTARKKCQTQDLTVTKWPFEFVNNLSRSCVFHFSNVLNSLGCSSFENCSRKGVLRILEKSTGCT